MKTKTILPALAASACAILLNACDGDDSSPTSSLVIGSENSGNGNTNTSQNTATNGQYSLRVNTVGIIHGTPPSPLSYSVGDRFNATITPTEIILGDEVFSYDLFYEGAVDSSPTSASQVVYHIYQNDSTIGVLGLIDITGPFGGRHWSLSYKNKVYTGNY
ncbi:MAG: hypothetical protein ACQKBY_00450 [Verrucomicrobiales bacterium]